MICLAFTSAAGVGGRCPAPSVLDRFDLRAGEVWRGRAQGPACVRVLDGTVWITREGDAADYVLRAGETFHAEARGLIVVQAMEDARMVVCPFIGRGTAA